ncbi:hypothetical protein UlMin_003526 [Ulmus minor]
MVNFFCSFPNHLIFIIISYLSFKEAARTSILSNRFFHIWRETKNIILNQRFFVSSNGEFEVKEGIGRGAFIDLMRIWIEHHKDHNLDKFSLILFSLPQNFHEDISKFITFAIERKVKALGLDFSNLMWMEKYIYRYHHASFDLPLSVYSNKAIKALKLFSCNFIAPNFANFCSFKQLCLGYIKLPSKTLKALLVNCEKLESLILERCWIDWIHISNNNKNLKLERLIVENCATLQEKVSIGATMLRRHPCRRYRVHLLQRQ